MNRQAPLPLTVLVVDDNPMMRELAGTALTLFGYDTDLAADGDEAVRRVSRTAYDVVITDLRMPGMNGWDVAKAVRRIRPGVGLVAMSGSLLPSNDGELPAGPDGCVCLSKPFELETLRNAVDSATVLRAA
jgi:CheY-like chemotaxis protein